MNSKIVSYYLNGKQLGGAFIDLTKIVKKIRKYVMNKTNSKQCIEFSDLLTNDVFFKSNMC